VASGVKVASGFSRKVYDSTRKAEEFRHRLRRLDRKLEKAEESARALSFDLFEP
jgi:hypothetical protein